LLFNRLLDRVEANLGEDGLENEAEII